MRQDQGQPVEVTVIRPFPDQSAQSRWHRQLVQGDRPSSELLAASSFLRLLPSEVLAVFKHASKTRGKIHPGAEYGVSGKKTTKDQAKTLKHRFYKKP